jgi:hypothetical protein
LGAGEESRMIFMKTRLTILALLALCLSGCVATPFKKLDAQIPDGNWEQADVKITGEVINANLKAKGTKKDGKWEDAEIHGTYNGYFVKELTIDLKKSK